MAEKKKNTKKGKTAHEMMQKHIKDKNDVITNEDFSNMEVGADLRLEDEKPLELDKKHPKDEDKDPKMITPWDVLKESQT
jgi:hypothetical protein